MDRNCVLLRVANTIRPKLAASHTFDERIARNQSHRLIRICQLFTVLQSNVLVTSFLLRASFGTNSPHPKSYVCRTARSKSAERNRQLSIVQLPAAASLLRTTAVHAMLFLNSRPMDDEHGTLFVSLSNGMLQMFSHHPQSRGFFEAFNAVHMAGDVVISMATDEANRYLLTGTSLGYIKTWLICNYW